MDPFTLEATVHRIGGADGPREYGPWAFQVYPNGETFDSVPARSGPSWVRLRLGRWALVRPGLVSAELRLEDMSGQPVGLSPRAVLVSTLPSDVPLYTNHIGPEQHGVYSVGLRIPRSVWTAEDVDTAATLEAHQREGDDHAGAGQVAEA